MTRHERADFPNLGNRYLIRPEDTDGRFALIEHLSGRMGAQIGDEVIEAGPGELVFKPRGIPHAFWNAGDEETRLLELISPGEFANYFAELAPHLNAEGPPDVEKLAEIQGPLVQRHGLQV